MAKALKVVGVVVGVVAIVASAGALLAPAAAATATTAATAGGFLGMSAATLGTIGMVASLAGGVLSMATALFAPKPSFSGGGNPLSFTTNPQSGLPYCIGRTRMSGLRIHADTYDGLSYKSEGKDDILAFAVMLSAGGEIEEIESFCADKEVITFDPTTGMGTGSWTDWMAQKVSLGLSGVSALALAFGGAFTPGWTANHQLSGITHALWSLRGDPKGEHYGAGVPEPEWVGKWVKVYDPRKDSTYPGGSGTHRALDESTYEWSANPFLHGLTWALGRWQNGKRTVGIGAPVSNIRVADFVEGANIADANGWEAGGVEWSTEPKWSTLKRMLQAGGGEPTMTGAMIGCRVNAPRVSIATVTATDLMDSGSFPTTRSRRDRFNTVIPRFRSEDHEWAVISGAPISIPAYVTEDRGQRTKEIDFPLVQSEAGGAGLAQVGQLAAYEIVNSREAGPWQFTVGPKFVGVKTGDVITLDIPDEDIAAQPVLIRSRRIDPATGKITFEAETETDAKHDFALGKTAVPPPSYTPTPPDLTPPTPSDALWSIDAELVDNAPAVVIAGACEFPGADAVLIEYRKVGETDWQTMPKSEASAPVNLVISPVDPETDYEARLAYQSGSRIGGWLDLGPVTTLPNPATDAVANFNARNDRNPSTPNAPWLPGGGAAIDHVTNTDGSVDISFEWGYTSPAGDDDCFEVMVRASTSSAPYTAGNTPGEEDRRTVPIDKTAIFLMGVNPTAWYTFAARTVRVVDPDVWDAWAAGYPALAATTVKPNIVSAWTQSAVSGENPYRPASNASFSGDLAGTIYGGSMSAASLFTNATRAANAINSDYTISGGKVITSSVATDAINNASYAKLLTLVGMAASDHYQELAFGSSFDVSAGTLVVEEIVPIQLSVTDPNPGDVFSVTFKTKIENNAAPGTYLHSDDVILEERWDGAAATGTFDLARRIISFHWQYTGLSAGTYQVGIDVTTDSVTSAYLPRFRYIKAEDMRAIK